MLPMAELAQNPFCIDDLYCYYHQRAPYPAKRKDLQHRLVLSLLDKPTLKPFEPKASTGQPAKIRDPIGCTERPGNIGAATDE